jgi:hypothetical protein
MNELGPGARRGTGDRGIQLADCASDARIALRDPAEKEVQFKIIEPPKAQLLPGETAHFKTSFDHPDEAATGVVVTFAKR